MTQGTYPVPAEGVDHTMLAFIPRAKICRVSPQAWRFLLAGNATSDWTLARTR